MLRSLFKSRQPSGRVPTAPPTLVVDVHAHILPGLDDGADTLEESLHLVEGLANQGFLKLVATPHIMGTYYPNTPALIQQRLTALQKGIRERGINIEITAAAEYYLDEHFVRHIQQQQDLLSFGKARYVLFETTFVNQPAELSDVISLLLMQGYQPVMAHPERCLYLQKKNRTGQKNAPKDVVYKC